jgi:predicted RNA-binding Zn-ribbon protein involved in translation (DUF1610 family)
MGGSSWDLAFIALAWLLGLLAVVLVGWALLWDRPRGRRRCPKCWYDMEASAEVAAVVCPECGNQIETDRELRKTRRRWGMALLALPLLAGAYAVPRAPDVHERGLVALVPTRVLIAAVTDEHVSNWWWLSLPRRLKNAAQDPLWDELEVRIDGLSARNQRAFAARLDGVLEGTVRAYPVRSERERWVMRNILFALFVANHSQGWGQHLMDRGYLLDASDAMHRHIGDIVEYLRDRHEGEPLALEGLGMSVRVMSIDVNEPPPDIAVWPRQVESSVFWMDVTVDGLSETNRMNGPLVAATKQWPPARYFLFFEGDRLIAFGPADGLEAVAEFIEGWKAGQR